MKIFRNEKTNQYTLAETNDGRIRIVDTTAEKAEAWARSLAEKFKVDFDKEYPNFKKSFKLLQDHLKNGWTKRQDMPVIDEKDVRSFKYRLEKGLLDIKPPFTKSNPFPEFLKGKEATEMLTWGMKDGAIDDDKVKVKQVKRKVSDLKPIQKEVYMDKSFKNLIEFGKASSKKFLQNASVIISNDNYIIDGHHRLAQSYFVDPKMSVSCIEVDLPIETLLKISLTYGDAIGNKRNK